MELGLLRLTHRPDPSLGPAAQTPPRHLRATLGPRPDAGEQPMSRWIFEPGHTAATFRARHMMVTWVRGLFTDIHGWIELDPAHAMETAFEGEIDVTTIWTGEPDRDAHLRSADFFDVDHHPTIRFTGRAVERIGDSHAKVLADVTIRGTTRPVPLDVAYLGQWEAPFWVGDDNRGTMRRIGFEATTRINRHDFGVSWQDSLPLGGVVVSNEIDVAIDVEAISRDDLERTGAIEHYR
jgi:polyisoprenoid-binding protein YceI